MSDFYSMDKTESILTNYLMIGDFAVCLHHAPDEITGQELPKWYRIQVSILQIQHLRSVFYNWGISAGASSGLGQGIDKRTCSGRNSPVIKKPIRTS